MMTAGSSTPSAEPTPAGPPPNGPRGLLRPRPTEGHGKVTNIELFFDLVFVYAVTQLSHTLQQQLNLAGATQVLLLFLAVWWVWIFTGWVTNWLDPDRPVVRLLMLVLTLAALLLSAALPQAFAQHGWLFAGAYVFMQVGRSLFMLWALRVDAPDNRRNFQRITIWLLVSAGFWLVGASQPSGLRQLLWMVALAIEYTGPAATFYVPGLGHSSTSDWDIDGGHLAERCSLFVIIALGESVVVTGSGFADAGMHGPLWAAFIAAFIGIVAMWWIYFDLGAERGNRAISQSDDPGRQARLAYTYMHLLIVAGIVVVAVGDRLALAEPVTALDRATVWILCGGAGLYLLGNGLFKKTVNSVRFPLSHLAGLVALLLLFVFGSVLSVLMLDLATTAVLVIVAVWESVSLRSVRRELAQPEH